MIVAVEVSRPMDTHLTVPLCQVESRCIGLIVWLVEADVVLGQFKVRSVVVHDSDNYL